MVNICCMFSVITQREAQISDQWPEQKPSERGIDKTQVGYISLLLY